MAHIPVKLFLDKSKGKHEKASSKQRSGDKKQSFDAMRRTYLQDGSQGSQWDPEKRTAHVSDTLVITALRIQYQQQKTMMAPPIA